MIFINYVLDQLRNLLDELAKDEEFIISIQIKNIEEKADVRKKIHVKSSGNQDGKRKETL